MRYLVLENILTKEEEQIIKTEAGKSRFKINMRDGYGGFEYIVKDLEKYVDVGIKFDEDDDNTVIHYAINAELVATASISKNQIGTTIEIELYNDKNMSARGTLADHNLTILQENDILARIDRMMFRQDGTYIINIEENHDYEALVLAICVSLDKFLQENKGDDDHRRRLFGTRFSQ